MALTWDNVSALTGKKWIPKLVDNIFDSNPTLQHLREKGQNKTVDGGTSLMMPLEYATDSSSGWYVGSEPLTTDAVEVITAAEYSWKQAYASIMVTGLEELKNQGDSQKIDLVKAKVKNAEKTLSDKLGTGIFSAGTDAKSIVGTGVWMSNSNTVGGISQSTYSWWRPASLDTSTTTLTLSALQTQHNAATVGNDGPDFGVTTRANYNRFWALLQPQQRFMSEDKAKAGFSSLLFNGTPVVVDSHATTALFAFLNTRYIALTALEGANFKFSPFLKPTNGDYRVAQILWAGALGCSNLRMQTALTAITA